MSDTKQSVFVYDDRMDLMVFADREGELHPVRSVSDWQVRRADILRAMELVMGQLPPEGRAVDPAVDIKTETALDDGCVRRRISFAPEADDRIPAYLFLPPAISQAVPGVLCLHQTTEIGKGEPAGIGGKPNLHYARELAARGFVTLAPDYPKFGDYEIDVYERGYASATMKAIFNHMRALDLLQSLPEVRRDRLGCIGHSLGGHNTLFLAAFDHRVEAAVTSCGFNSFLKYKSGDISGWSHDGYMPRIAQWYDADATQMPFDFAEVLGAIAPRSVFISAPEDDSPFTMDGVQDCVRAARPVFELLHADGELVSVHPPCAHDFPPDIREQAYSFLEDRLSC
ncbi:MAG: prolyl oligopeptidase family serine peptidase [Armatimonadota bacterium]